MSGVEVVAAVSAIVSAFHAGSEILKHVKAKRRKSREAQQEFQEKQLQDSLVAGEQQIGSRYVQDIRDFGDLMRVGDDIAHSRLQHITIMMQDAVIKDLHKAAQFEYAYLNLTFLHEASIMSRKDAANALDELKQRILMRTPLGRHVDGYPMPYPNRSYNEAERKLGTTISRPTNLMTDNYLPATKHIDQDAKKSRNGPQGYIRQEQHNDFAPNLLTGSNDFPRFNYSAALQKLAEEGGSVDAALMMTKGIDDVIDSYQRLHMHHIPSGQWEANQFPKNRLGRRDTLAMLNGDDFYPRNPPTANREGPQVPKSLPPTPETYEMEEDARNPAHNPQSFFSEVQNQQYTQRGPKIQVQTQSTRPRWSVASNSSSIYSDHTSYHSGSSSSPQGLQSYSAPVPNSFPSMTSNLSPYQNHTNQYETLSEDPSLYSFQPDDNHPPVSPLSQTHRRSHSDQSTFRCSPISTISSQRETIPIMYSPYSESNQQLPSHAIAPFMQPQYRQEPLQYPPVDQGLPTSPKHHLLSSVSSVVRKASGKPSNNRERAMKPSPAISETPRPAGYVRNTSIASSSSSGSSTLSVFPHRRLSNNIRIATIQSAPAGAERMLVGRPCKDNNYWGFCKGAWSIREDVKKGLALRTQPSGMYSSKEIWECTSCSFHGATFSASHPTKSNKTTTVIDPRVSTSECGIRYKWIFLAKSHVKQKSNDGSVNEYNYGCIICSVEGHVTSVYGGVETLMNHIASSHVTNMSEQTRMKVNCVLGRVAGKEESGWDINIPVIEQAAELAG